MVAGMFDNGFDQLLPDPGLSGIGPYIHPPQEALMSLLFALPDNKSGDS